MTQTDDRKGLTVKNFALFLSGAFATVQAQVAALRAVPAAHSLTTTYFQGQHVTSGGLTYASVQDGNTGHPVTDTAWWRQVGGTGAKGDQGIPGAPWLPASPAAPPAISWSG